MVKSWVGGGGVVDIGQGSRLMSENDARAAASRCAESQGGGQPANGGAR